MNTFICDVCGKVEAGDEKSVMDGEIQLCKACEAYCKWRDQVYFFLVEPEGYCDACGVFHNIGFDTLDNVICDAHKTVYTITKNQVAVAFLLFYLILSLGSIYFSYLSLYPL